MEKNKTGDCRQLYVTARDECTALISARKMDYFRNQLEKATNKNLFRLLRSLGNNLNSVWLLKNANYFLVFFVERLTIPYQVCSVSTTSIGHQTKDVISLTVLMCLIEQRTQRSQRFVVLLRKRACWIICLQISSLTTSPVLCLPSDASLDEGVMPKSLKHAIIRPLLKKPSLDKDILSSYRPVSNLTQLSQVIEKVVALRIMTHVSDQQMVECFQSSYRQKPLDRNCAVVCYKCRQTAMNKQQGTILLLVDFSSAFDTINHNILITRLRLRYGFVGKTLDWVISYLKERTQRVVIGDQSSSTTTLTTGVQQGSVLGPLHFSLYVQPIGDIIRANGLFFHQYADDLQVYAHFDLTRSVLVAAVKQMEDCLDEVKVWMARNSMFMNEDTTSSDCA